MAHRGGLISAFGSLLYWILTIFLVLLIARAVLDLVFSVGRVGRPSGAALRLVEVVYGATDPALRLVRRHIPPLRLGNTAFDLGFLLMFVVIVVLRGVVSTF